MDLAVASKNQAFNPNKVCVLHTARTARLELVYWNTLVAVSFCSLTLYINRHDEKSSTSECRPLLNKLDFARLAIL